MSTAGTARSRLPPGPLCPPQPLPSASPQPPLARPRHPPQPRGRPAAVPGRPGGDSALGTFGHSPPGHEGVSAHRAHSARRGCAVPAVSLVWGRCLPRVGTGQLRGSAAAFCCPYRIVVPVCPSRLLPCLSCGLSSVQPECCW